MGSFHFKLFNVYYVGGKVWRPSAKQRWSDKFSYLIDNSLLHFRYYNLHLQKRRAVSHYVRYEYVPNP
jgi:hypothetical protein